MHTFYNDNQEETESCFCNAVMRHQSRAKRPQYAAVLALHSIACCCSAMPQCLIRACDDVMSMI